jgi:hypothetical protein
MLMINNLCLLLAKTKRKSKLAPPGAKSLRLTTSSSTSVIESTITMVGASSTSNSGPTVVTIPSFPASSYVTPLQVTPDMVSLNTTSSTVPGSHVAQLDFQSPPQVIKEEPFVTSSSPSIGRSDVAEANSSPLKIIVEELVHVDPQTGSPYSPQCEKTFVVERNDVQALLAVVDTAIEGFTRDQLLELQQSLGELFVQHERQTEYRHAHISISVPNPVGRVHNPLLPQMYSSAVSSSTAYVDSTPEVNPAVMFGELYNEVYFGSHSPL